MNQSMHKEWIARAKQYLNASLSPVAQELNELDWKASLSNDKERLSHHVSAFANQIGGGFFVFGINKSGVTNGVSPAEIDKIINKTTNLSRDGLEPPQIIDYCIESVANKSVLIVYVKESSEKPVHLKEKGIEFSYIRSGGQTRKMSRQEIATAILSSRNVRYEELEALRCSKSQVTQLLDHQKLFSYLNINESITHDALMGRLEEYKLIRRNGDAVTITNLGVIVASRDLKKFPGKERFGARVIKYRDNNRIEAEQEKEFFEGYGVGFQALIKYILSELPTSEVIKDALRTDVPIYPEVAIRELVANALIHRDFAVTTTNPMIEIFADRMEILNPGTLLPSIKIERIIDTASESRNELFANMMRHMRICEERGTGIDRALLAIELYGLPPVEFIAGENTFRAIIYKPKKFKQMSRDERKRACFQHCCLRWVSRNHMTNTSFRKRLGLSDEQYPAAWNIIRLCVREKMIKLERSCGKSRKYASYVPFWV